jgi:hypothetical protein
MGTSMALITKSFIITWYLRRETISKLGKYRSETDRQQLNYTDRFEPVDPVRFRVGDMVEVQATVVAIPVKNNKFKTIVQLRSLALIDGSFTEVSVEQNKSNDNYP